MDSLPDDFIQSGTIKINKNLLFKLFLTVRNDKSNGMCKISHFSLDIKLNNYFKLN